MEIVNDDEQQASSSNAVTLLQLNQIISSLESMNGRATSIVESLATTEEAIALMSDTQAAINLVRHNTGSNTRC
jgi:hypothetical protein